MSDDARAVAELSVLSDGDTPHIILHYVYVPSSECATSIAAELRRRGFHSEQRLGADGVNWLVLAHEEAVPTETHMALTREFLEGLAGKVGGEYDGWEAEIRRANRLPPCH